MYEMSVPDRSIPASHEKAMREKVCQVPRHFMTLLLPKLRLEDSRVKNVRQFDWTADLIQLILTFDMHRQ
jgi:hypothetical protein